MPSLEMQNPPLAPSLVASVLPSVLVVEDDQHVRTVLHDMLEEDYVVISATTVKEALSFLERKCIDIVLLDYNLSGETGKAVAEQAEQTGIPLVCMSGDSALFDDLYVTLPKPFNCQQVLDVLAKAQHTK